MRDRKYIFKKINKFKKDYNKYKFIKKFLTAIIFYLVFIIIYFSLILAELFLYKKLIIINSFIFIVIVNLVIAQFKNKSERKIIKKADNKLQLEQRLITYYDYQKEKKDNPFFSSLEIELAALLKKRTAQNIYKLKWQKYFQYAALLLGVIIFLNSYFNINNDYKIKFNSINNFSENKINEDKSYNYEKIKFIDPLDLNIENKIGEEISQTNYKDINKINNKKLNNDFEENTKKPDLEKRKKRNLSELENKLGNIKEQSDKKNESIGEDKEKIYKYENKNKEDQDENIEGPGAKSSEDSSENKEKKYNVFSEKEKQISNKGKVNGEGNSNNGNNSGDKIGLGAGENKGDINNKDDFSKTLDIEKNERLKSQISNDNYLNIFLEEKYNIQNKKESDNILDSYINYRSFLLDSVREENIPFVYKEMIKDYFIIIKD